jgi:two-component system nitrogen regulation sensor histidine kinase GlnL
MKAPYDILDHQTCGVLILDAELKISYLNQAAEALLQASQQQLLGEPIHDALNDRDTLDDALAAVLADGQSFTKRGALVRTVSGAELHVDYTVSPILDRVPNELLIEIQPLDRLLGINRDGHQVDIQETTQKLVRGLAHEIKNPLGGIRGAAQLLDRELSTERQRDYTRIIIEEADRLRNLVDRMLGPSRLPTLTNVNVHHVLEHLIQLVEAEQPGRIRIERDYDPSLPEIEGDLDQLIQALLNVVRNAQQAMEDTDEPTLTLRTRIIRQFTIGARRHRLVVQIDISDNGCGIPEELGERIYYPMISGRANGSGLGLSIAQNIVNQHHGLIKAESQPGRTTFSVILPLDQSIPESSDNNAGPGASRHSNGATP